VSGVNLDCAGCGDDIAVARCRVCGENGLSSVLCLGRAPLANEFLPERLAPSARYPLHVVHCGPCGLAQLATGVDPRRLFDEYAYFSSASKPLVDHGGRLRDFVWSTLDPPVGGLIVELGSNDGYLLRPYAAEGLRVLGIDPAANVAAQARASGVPTLGAYFGSTVADQVRRQHGPSHVVHANNVLAHTPDIADVLRGVRILLDGGDGAFVVETPSLLDIVSRGLVDTIYHEHIYYYSFTAFQRLLDAAGMTAVHVEGTDAHGGSLRIVARAGRATVDDSVPQWLSREREAGVGRPDFYEDFALSAARLIDDVRAGVAAIVGAGHRVAGFGAAAKATMMVAATDVRFSYICDSTPYKQGRALPGTTIPIVAPERLLTDPTDCCVILAWNYADAIVAANQEYLRRGGTFLTIVDSRLQPVGPAPVAGGR
jgi:hypothetical protein